MIVLFFVLQLLGCVGVIEDGNKGNTGATAAISPAIFDGIYDGWATSHNSINIRFKPASGGSGDFTYLVYLDGNPNVYTSILASKAYIDQHGYINLSLTGLDYNTSYDVNVRAMDAVTEKITATLNKIPVWTSDTFVPEFKGVSKVEPASGANGMTSIVLYWNQAATADITSGDAFDPSHAVSGYNIYYSKYQDQLEDVLKLEEQHNPSLTSFQDTYIISVSNADTVSYTVSNLSIGTKYYFAVRARQSSSPPKYELNSKILSSTTLTEQPVEFIGVKTAAPPVDARGFSQIKVTWDACIGCSLYQVYAKPVSLDVGIISPQEDTDYLIFSTTNISLTSTTLVSNSKILPNSDYRVYAIACKDSNCGWNGSSYSATEISGRNVYKDVKTIPPVSPFTTSENENMISSVAQPSGITGITKLDISWSPFDLTKGYYTEARMYYVPNKNGNVTYIDGNPNVIELNRATTVPFGTPYIDPSTPVLDSSTNTSTARITNLNRDQEYCFIVLPWITGNGLDASEEVTLSSSLWPEVKCGIPQYIAPDFGTTSLNPVCIPQSGGASMKIEWTEPEALNIFSHYEIYYRDTAAPFSFTDAWNGVSTYKQDSVYPLVDYLTNSVIINGLVPNTNYYFGVNTYYLPQGEVTPLKDIPALSMATTDACLTQAPTMIHSGWKDILAVGPKTNGATGLPIAEILGEDRRIPFEDVAGTTHGIVHLSWIDFELSGMGMRLKDFESGASSGLGYFVYRLKIETDADLINAQDSSYDKWSNPAFATKLKFNLVENGNGKFAYSSDSIMADGSSVYLIPSTHGIDTDGENRFEFVDYPPSEGAIYLYKVVAVFNNQEVEFDDTQASDNVLKVVVPHTNEAFVHRKMANLSICEQYGRGIGITCTDLQGRCSDPENNYRCLFRGLGSVEDAGESYIDIGSSFVMDRFEASCNYSRGKCTKDGVDYQDCIADTPSTQLTHSPGFESDPIYAFRTASSPQCWYKENAAGSWKAFSSMSDVEIGANPDMISNEAKLPATGGTSLFVDSASCDGKTTAQYYSADVVRTKKVMSRKQFIVASQWESKLDDSEAGGIESGVNAVNDISYRDCLSGDQLEWGNAAYEGAAYVASGNVTCADDLTGVDTCVLNAGSAGDYSSELCVSRFGVQDLIGNLNEINIDRISGTDGQGMQSLYDISNEDVMALRWDTDTIAPGQGAPGDYYNLVFGLPLSCSGVGGYNSDISVMGSHQCREDDLIPEFVASYYHNDEISLSAYPQAFNLRLYSGGMSQTNQKSGRYFLNATGNESGGGLWHVGFRCLYTID